ncbi:hypothetical protein H2248_006811 [Termitomyces sp. 'cryptogamus']|nr:hypothetical protein H2248_006811 [Termitomyces sp. 'cryptogamus']
MAPRPAHRQRGSVLCLSSDTTHSLPVYVPNADDNADDRPPDYPDSADEADEETDSSDSSLYVPPPPPPSSFSLSCPRRRRLTSSVQQQTHRRRHSTHSSQDPFLDSLLARSVHALEMSNTLLQSSMSTQTALSTIFADSPTDDVLENSARGLSMRIQRLDAQPKWADDLAEISRGVDRLFAEEQVASNVSCSLPTASSPIKQAYYRHKRRPSLLELGHKGGGRPHLHLSYQERSDLVAPPPRALTQYVGAKLDPGSIYLPSTMGARASASSLNLHPLHAPLSSPKITETLLEPATPAYNMLSSFVTHRSPSASTSSSSTPAALSSPLPALPSFFSNISRRNSSSSRRKPSIDQSSTSPPTSTKAKSPNTTRANSQDRSPSSLSLTPLQIHTSLPHHRPMTPPAEESGSGSSSDGGYLAKRTILSLRKILDEQPPPQPKRLRAPAFLPRTPAPVAEARTSTATASISRLYTKGKHTSSTRPPSPPRQSAMKQPQSQPLIPTSEAASTIPSSDSKAQSQSQSPPPTTTMTVFHFPDLLNVRNWSSTSLRSLGGGGEGGRNGSSSALNSGRSTPKRISFAELPESYKGSTSARFSRGRRKRGRGKGTGRRGGSGNEDEGEGEGEGGWWSSWFSGGGGSLNAREERFEERLGRSWSGRMPGAPTGFGPGADEWAV